MLLRTFVIGVIRHLGLMDLWRRAKHNQISVLTFHGVCSARELGQTRPLKPRLWLDDFAGYINLLRREFRLISLSEAFDMLSGYKPLKARSLVLTFDDGYLNNATHVWPILRQFDAPAVFFVPTGFMNGEKLFWTDRLDHAVRHLQPDMECLPVDGVELPIAGRDEASLMRLFWQARSACLAFGWQQAENAVSAIELHATSKLADCPREAHWSGFMNWTDIHRMSAQGAEFGSHTVRHIPLGELSPREIASELEESKSQFELNTGRACWALAYPRGDCNHQAVEAALVAGYRCGLTTEERPAMRNHSMLQLPRVGLPERPLSETDLLVRATGLSKVLSDLHAGNGTQTGAHA